MVARLLAWLAGWPTGWPVATKHGTWDTGPGTDLLLNRHRHSPGSRLCRRRIGFCIDIVHRMHRILADTDTDTGWRGLVSRSRDRLLHFMHLLVCSLWIYWTRFYRSNKCCILQVVQVPANVSLKTALINEPGWKELEVGSWELLSGAGVGSVLALHASGSFWSPKKKPRECHHILAYSAKILWARLTNCGNQSGVVSRQSGLRN